MIINFSNLGGGGGSYTLPTATSQTLGGVKIGSGVTVASDGTISVEGSDSSVLKSVAELPSDAELGDVVSLASSGESYPDGITYERRTYTDGDGVRFVFPDGSLTGYTMDNPLLLGYVSASTTLAGMYAFYDNEYHTYNFSVSSDGNLSDPDINVYMNDGEQGANPFDGAVFEFDIVGQDRIIDVYPDASMGVTSIVFEGLPEGGSLGVFQYDGDNWNQIGAGGGNGTPLIPEISVLPENPEDGAVYNYNGTLIKYVDGPGNWGEWGGAMINTTYVWQSDASNSRNSIALNSAVDFSANTSDGDMICQFRYMSSSNYDKFFFIDNTNSQILVYPNSGATGSSFTAITKNGAEVQISAYGNANVKVKWEGNIINFNYGNPGWFPFTVTPSATTGHYELVEGPKVLASNVWKTPGYGGQEYKNYGQPSNALYPLPAKIDANYNIVEMGATIAPSSVRLNNSYYKPILTMAENSYGNLPNFWAPTTAGNQNDVLISSGSGAPTWQAISQLLGVSFWTGTQDEYDALGSYSPTTLYIIIPE